MEDSGRTVPDAPVGRGAGRVLLDAIPEAILNFAFFFVHFAAWLIQWSVALVIFLCIMAGAGYYVYTQALRGGEMIKVPDVVGYPITEAANVLREQGLEMAVLDEDMQVRHPTVPKYHIISQRPKAGTVVRTGHKIRPLVSIGTGFAAAPDVTRKTLEQARQMIEQARFRNGTVARIPDRSPRDTVIAQDPPAKKNIPNDGEIHLLVSAGSDMSGVFMPNLRGKHVSEIEGIMEPYNVILRPEYVNARDVMPDTVLNQDPAPYSLIYEGQVVTYQVRRSGSVEIPDARHEGYVRHVMPYDWYDMDVRVEVVDRAGNRTVLMHWTPMFDGPSKASRVEGTPLVITVPYIQEARVEIYVDGALVETYIFKDGNDPVRASDQPG